MTCAYYHEDNNDVVINVKNTVVPIFELGKNSHYTALYYDGAIGSHILKQIATSTAFVYRQVPGLARTGLAPLGTWYVESVSDYRDRTRHRPIVQKEEEIAGLVAYDLTEPNSQFYKDKLTIKISI